MSTKHKQSATVPQLGQRHRYQSQSLQPKALHSSGQAALVGQAVKAKPGFPAPARERNRYKSRRLHIPWLPVLLLVIGGLVIAALIASDVFQSPPQGTLTATNTSYDFGTVPMKGGNITTQFPLAVEGDARAVDLTST